MKKINLTMKKLFHEILSKAVQFEIRWAILSSVLVQSGCIGDSMWVQRGLASSGWTHRMWQCEVSTLLDVVHLLAPLKLYRLNSLDRLCKLSLNRDGLDDDVLRRACTSDHLASDDLKLLLRIQLNCNLVDLPSGRDDRLDNLDSSWRSCFCAWLLHLMVWLSLLLLLRLLELELEHLGLLLVHSDRQHTR